ncbi:MAG: dihydrodipicolinate synthase family protein [Pseudomonadota bacterium]
MSVLKGLSAFTVTPTDDAGRVDTDHLAQFVARLRRPGISSIGVLGSTGGYMYLDARERKRAIETAVEAAGDTPVLAGVGALTTREVLAHIRDAQDAGATAVLVAPVSYLPLVDADVTALFRDVRSATTLPVCFYNNPGTTGFTPSEELIRSLAANGTIDAVKMPPAPNGDFASQITRLRDETPDDFIIGYSGDSAIAGALRDGADAWYSVLAGTLPEIAIALWNARRNDAERDRLTALLRLLFNTFDRHGSIRIIHEVVDLIGLGTVALPCPLLPLDSEVRESIAHALDLLPEVRDKAA